MIDARVSEVVPANQIAVETRNLRRSIMAQSDDACERDQNTVRSYLLWTAIQVTLVRNERAIAGFALTITHLRRRQWVAHWTTFEPRDIADLRLSRKTRRQQISLISSPVKQNLAFFSPPTADHGRRHRAGRNRTATREAPQVRVS